MNEFFNNSGSKIKVLAKVNLSIASIVSIVISIVLISNSDDYFFGTQFLMVGLFNLFFGPLIVYIFSLFLYGFGELVETNSKMVGQNKIEKQEEKLEFDNNIREKVIAVYTKMVVDGKITSDQFNSFIKYFEDNCNNN